VRVRARQNEIPQSPGQAKMCATKAAIKIFSENPDMRRARQSAGHCDAAECLLEPHADTLADGIAAVPGGSPVDRRAAAAGTVQAGDSSKVYGH
jgi:hypothetical protein